MKRETAEQAMTADGGHMTACCNAPLRVGGNVTHWYECSKCGKAVDEMSARKYLEEVRARADKATEGPWETNANARPGIAGFGDVYTEDGATAFPTRVLLKLNEYFPRRDDDAAFIAAARTDVPKLADMLRIALDALDAIRQNDLAYIGNRDAADALAEIDRRAEEA